MMTLTFGRPWFVSTLIGLLATLYVVHARSAVLTFEPEDANVHFVFEEMGPYQPIPYDAPDDGADHLAQQTSSQWVGMKSGESDAASLYWDGGLDGGSNSLLNLLLPDSFDLTSFVIAGVYGSQTVTLQGLNDGQLLYTGSLAIDLTPQLYLAGWLGIDQLRIVSGDDFVVHPDHASAGVRRNWAVDNLIYDETVVAVPLPASGLLFAAGSLLLGLGGRRTAAPGGK